MVSVSYSNNYLWPQLQPTQYALIPFTLIDNAETAIPHTDASNQLRVFPNPAVNELRLAIPSNVVVLSVYFMDGKQVWKEKVTPEYECRICISDWLQGVYIIKAEGVNGESQTIRFVKI